MTPSELIAKAIRREREKAGLSLSALAQKAGLAKSTLSQLEAGKGNPSVETLWAIAASMGIPFSFLFETGPVQSELVRASEGVTIGSDQAEFDVVLLSKCAPARSRDLYRFVLNIGATRKAEAHPAGTVEHIFVCSGSVCVGPEGHEETLHVGDYYRYPGDQPHSYKALTKTATLLLAMESTG